jgi:hypothetical protein
MGRVDPIGFVDLVIYHHPKLYFLVSIALLAVELTYYYTKPALFRDDSFSIVLEVLSSFDQAPINDIYLLGNTSNSSTASCTSGYQTLQVGQWDGTSDGCACTQTIMNRGYCGISAGNCTSISAAPAMPFTKWENSTFCYSTVQNFYYSYGGSCPGGYTSCGTNSYCMPSSQPCPITDMKIMSQSYQTFANYIEIDLPGATNVPQPPASATPNATNTTNTTNTTTTPTIYGDKLIFARQSGFPGILSFTVSFYDVPCFNPNLHPYSRSMGGYPLSAVAEDGCRYYGNYDNSVKIDDLSIQEVFQENNALTKANSLPWYSLYFTNQSAYWVGLLQFQVNPNLAPCQNMDVRMLRNVEHFEYDYDYYFVALGMTALALTALLSITYGAEMRVRQVYDYYDVKVFAITVINLVFYITLAVVHIALGAWIYHNYFVWFLPLSTYFSNIASLNCFSDYTVNIAFKNMYNHFDLSFNGVNYYSEVLMVFSAASLGIFIMALIARGILVIIKRRGGLESVATEEDERYKVRSPAPQTGVELLFTTER